MYLHDYIQQISKDPQCQCTFLSSGMEYTLDGKLRVVKTRNCFEDRVDSFKIINSPVHAPAYIQFLDLQTYLNDTTLLDLLEKFWAEQGGFDVVHFHNMEGLSLPVLRLKERHPETKFYYSLHNYFLFCPQVNLWTSTGRNCYCTPLFPECSGCINAPDTKLEKLIESTKSILNHMSRGSGTAMYNACKKAANTLRNFTSKKRNQNQGMGDKSGGVDNIYSEYRRRNVSYANMYFDLIFAVSQRTSEIAQAYGICSEKICVDYIGTAVASNQQPPHRVGEGVLRVGFLGYARKDKGFDLLIEALSQVSTHAAEKMDILLAAKCETEELYEEYNNQLRTALKYFHHYRFINGYSKLEQSQLVKEIDVGVVPHLWEDNLPQVSIEYIAAGVPIIVSDAGGAKELCTNPSFVYSSQDAGALCRKLEKLALNPDELYAFWDKMPILTCMENHVQSMKLHYMQK